MKTRVDYTESGDKYSGTDEAWARYRKAWADNDMDLVMEMETGGHEDFFYDPDGVADDEGDDDPAYEEN